MKFFLKNNSDSATFFEQEDWFSEKNNEGELSIDAYESNEHLVIRALVAGVNLDDLDIEVHSNILTIRGERKDNRTREQRAYLYKECFWGKFSRTIVLPDDAETQKISAKLDNGVLTISFRLVAGEVAAQKIKVQEISSVKTAERKIHKK